MALEYPITLAEFIALLHHGIQQAIEHLAQPELRQIAKDTPSASFVKIENLRINVPIRIVSESVKITPEEIQKLPVLSRVFQVTPDRTLGIFASSMNPVSSETTRNESTLEIEFSVAAK